MRSQASVVVIGGGVLGCSMIYQLARHGRSDAVLLERGQLTSGSTWHAAGQVPHFSESAFYSRLQKESFDLYQTLERETGSYVNIHVCGGVRLARSTDELLEFKRFVTSARRIGIEASVVGPNEVRNLWPLLESDKHLGALHTPFEGHVDPSQVTQALAKGARDKGAEINLETTVVRIGRRRSGEWEVSTDKGTIVTDAIVNCGGCWAPEISRLLGHFLPVVTMEHQYLVTEQAKELSALAGELPVLRDYNVPLYARQERNGLLFSGYERDVRLTWLEGAPADSNMQLFQPDLERAGPCLEETFEMIPVLKNLGIRTVINGPIPGTPDMQGLVGPVHGIPRYYVLCGIHGAFLHSSAARYLCEWIVEGEPSLDLSRLDVRRFGTYVTKDYTVSRVTAEHIWSAPAYYPHTEPVGGRPARTDPLYGRVKPEGAVYGVQNGWEVANWFAPTGVLAEDCPTYRRANWFHIVAEECRALRSKVGLINLSHLSKFEVIGAGAAAALNRLCASRVPAQDGERAVCLMLTPSGGVENLPAISRLDEGRYLLTVSAASEQRFEDWLRANIRDQTTHVANVTASRGLFLLAGPQSTSLLERRTRHALDSVGAGHSSAAAIGFAPVRLTRVDDVDASSWLIDYSIEHQLTIYERLTDGARDEVYNVGARALDSLRIERGLPKWGLDILANSVATDMGLGTLIDPIKTEFIGQTGSRRNGGRRLTLIAITDNEFGLVPWGGEPLLLGEQDIGEITSGAYGHTIGSALAFATMSAERAVPGMNVEIAMLGDRYPGQILSGPPV